MPETEPKTDNRPLIALGFVLVAIVVVVIVMKTDDKPIVSPPNPDQEVEAFTRLTERPSHNFGESQPTEIFKEPVKTEELELAISDATERTKKMPEVSRRAFLDGGFILSRKHVKTIDAYSGLRQLSLFPRRSMWDASGGIIENDCDTTKQHPPAFEPAPMIQYSGLLQSISNAISPDDDDVLKWDLKDKDGWRILEFQVELANKDFVSDLTSAYESKFGCELPPGSLSVLPLTDLSLQIRSRSMEKDRVGTFPISLGQQPNVLPIRVPIPLVDVPDVTNEQSVARFLSGLKVRTHYSACGFGARYNYTAAVCKAIATLNNEEIREIISSPYRAKQKSGTEAMSGGLQLKLGPIFAGGGASGGSSSVSVEVDPILLSGKELSKVVEDVTLVGTSYGTREFGDVDPSKSIFELLKLTGDQLPAKPEQLKEWYSTNGRSDWSSDVPSTGATADSQITPPTVASTNNVSVTDDKKNTVADNRSLTVTPGGTVAKPKFSTAPVSEDLYLLNKAKRTTLSENTTTSVQLSLMRVPSQFVDALVLGRILPAKTENQKVMSFNLALDGASADAKANSQNMFHEIVKGAGAQAKGKYSVSVSAALSGGQADVTVEITVEGSERDYRFSKTAKVNVPNNTIGFVSSTKNASDSFSESTSGSFDASSLDIGNGPDANVPLITAVEKGSAIKGTISPVVLRRVATYRRVDKNKWQPWKGKRDEFDGYRRDNVTPNAIEANIRISLPVIVELKPAEITYSILKPVDAK